MCLLFSTLFDMQNVSQVIKSQLIIAALSAAAPVQSKKLTEGAKRFTVASTPNSQVPKSEHLLLILPQFGPIWTVTLSTHPMT